MHTVTTVSQYFFLPVQTYLLSSPSVVVKHGRDLLRCLSSWIGLFLSACLNPWTKLTSLPEQKGLRLFALVHLLSSELISSSPVLFNNAAHGRQLISKDTASCYEGAGVDNWQFVEGGNW